MQYYICFLLIYFTYILYIILLHYIYALNNLYVSIPIFWAGLQHHVQEQLPVCKQLYIKRQQVIKLLLTVVAETVLRSHKFWLIQSTLNKKKNPYSMKSYSNLRFQSVIQIVIQRPAGRWKGGKREQHYHKW